MVTYTLFENLPKCLIWIFKAPTVVKILYFKDDDTFLPLNPELFGENGIFYQFLSYDMSGNTVFPQATDFQKLAKIGQF